MKGKYFSLEKTNQAATLNIYGDITSWDWNDGEISATTLSKQLEALGDVEQIDVYINSYGGEVKEGLAIYNALRRHKAKVTTYCDGFACSIASVIFMAGDERVMNDASLLMIHNAWTCVAGNAEELRKQAEDLEKITQASVEAYKAHSSLSEEEIKELMDAETWILPSEAVEYGFATAIADGNNSKAKQNAFVQLFDIIKAHQEAKEPKEEINEEVDEEEIEVEETEVEEAVEAEEPEDDETPSDEEETSDDEESEEEPNDENASQKWAGFFNAILKM